jgi:hypothetical protein
MNIYFKMMQLNFEAHLHRQSAIRKNAAGSNTACTCPSTIIKDLLT